MKNVAHTHTIRYEDLPVYWVFSIEMPDDIHYYKRNELPDYWQDETYKQTQYWLKSWLASPDRLAVSVPLSYNIIIHPAHTLFEQVRVIDQEGGSAR